MTDKSFLLLVNFKVQIHLINWTVISAGNLPWTSEFDRNPLGLAISSPMKVEMTVNNKIS
jgi:hypothetical protein